jgi:hypothetical protein
MMVCSSHALRTVRESTRWGRAGAGRGEHSKLLISRRVRHTLPPWWCLSDNDGAGPDDEAVPLFS